MNDVTPEIDRLKMERHKIEIELKRHTDKIKILQEDKKALDTRIVTIINSSKDDKIKCFNSMF